VFTGGVDDEAFFRATRVTSPRRIK
jgi:hypothetical protein